MTVARLGVTGATARGPGVAGPLRFMKPGCSSASPPSLAPWPCSWAPPPALAQEGRPPEEPPLPPAAPPPPVPAALAKKLKLELVTSDTTEALGLVTPPGETAGRVFVVEKRGSSGSCGARSSMPRPSWT